jgi:hypothetical protein
MHSAEDQNEKDKQKKAVRIFIERKIENAEAEKEKTRI